MFYTVLLAHAVQQLQAVAYCLPKSIVKISETKKDYSARHTDNKLSFCLEKEVKIHFEHFSM